MERNIVLISLIVYFLLGTVISKPERRQDQDIKEVENNAAPNGEQMFIPGINDSEELKSQKGHRMYVAGNERNKEKKIQAVYLPEDLSDEKKHAEGKKNDIPGSKLEKQNQLGVSDVDGGGENKFQGEGSSETNCWLNINAKKHFEIMDTLDEKHHAVRKDFQEAITERNLNSEMLEMMLQTRAAAERAIHNAGEMPSKIPAGINLGGYGMMKLANAILFFHRMKLRNETNFRVNYINNDVYNMVLTARLSLNDLHLFGQYERAISDKDALFYRPTFGELELLLKSVTYKLEGRMRLVQSRLLVEHVLSDLHIKDVLLMYYINGSANCQKSEKLPPSAINEFLERLKADLDSWLKDFFNDYLLFFGLSDASANQELHCYDKQKQSHLNDFMDHTIKQMHNKLYSLTPSAADIKTPAFSLYSMNGVQVKLHSGVIRGMDSFYRQSVATGRADGKLRMVDAVIAFSKLKIEYKYLAKISGRTPPLMGLFVLSADELIAHLGVTMVKEPEAVDLSIGFLRQLRPQTLVIEGAINRMVVNFKHVLENEIITLMTNALLYHIKQLATLSRCEPTLQGHEDEGEANKNKSDDNEHHEKFKGFGMKRNDSIELEVPVDTKRLPKKMHIRYSQDFALSESELHGEPHLEQPQDLDAKGDIVHNEMTNDGQYKHEKLRKERKAAKMGKSNKGGKNKNAGKIYKGGLRGITT